MEKDPLRCYRLSYSIEKREKRERAQTPAEGFGLAHHGCFAARQAGATARLRCGEISLATRTVQGCGWQALDSTLHGKKTTKVHKTLLPTFTPVGGAIRVVPLAKNQGWHVFLCTDETASVLAEQLAHVAS